MTFDVGQKVVYPNHGVCLVEEISTNGFGTEQELYVLRLLSNNSKVMVPKENLELVGLRPLCSGEEIRTLFGILEDGNIDTYKDWKGRYKQNLDKMKTGRLTEVAEVLKNLCLVSQKKSLSFREKKMYERAKYFIVSEVAHVQDIDEAESEDLVEGLLAASLDKLHKRREEEKAKTKKDPKAKDVKAKDAKDAKDVKTANATEPDEVEDDVPAAPLATRAAKPRPSRSKKAVAARTAPRNGATAAHGPELRPDMATAAAAYETEERLLSSLA